MALQPDNRFAGSQHVLRFHGVVTPGTAIGTFPKDNGEMTTGGAVGDARGIRLLLADATDLLDERKQLPSLVYDDRQPTGAAPHDPVATAAVGLVTNAGEDDISLRTWAQNTFIVVKGLSANVVSFSTEDCVFVTDTLTSGLGLNTGLPVLIIPVVLSGEEVGDITVDVYIEVRHTVQR